jgi:hypothetical protein
MTDTGCPHPDVAIVTIDDQAFTLVDWCSMCGSIRDNNGDHGAPAGSWRDPTGLVLPGWTCNACGAFTGTAKEQLTQCRCCGTPKPEKPNDLPETT